MKETQLIIWAPIKYFWGCGCICVHLCLALASLLTLSSLLGLIAKKVENSVSSLSFSQPNVRVADHNHRLLGHFGEVQPCILGLIRLLLSPTTGIRGKGGCAHSRTLLQIRYKCFGLAGQMTQEIPSQCVQEVDAEYAVFAAYGNCQAGEFDAIGLWNAERRADFIDKFLQCVKLDESTSLDIVKFPDFIEFVEFILQNKKNNN